MEVDDRGLVRGLDLAEQHGQRGCERLSRLLRRTDIVGERLDDLPEVDNVWAVRNAVEVVHDYSP